MGTLVFLQALLAYKQLVEVARGRLTMLARELKGDLVDREVAAEPIIIQLAVVVRETCRQLHHLREIMVQQVSRIQALVVVVVVQVRQALELPEVLEKVHQLLDLL